MSAMSRLATDLELNWVQTDVYTLRHIGGDHVIVIAPDVALFNATNPLGLSFDRLEDALWYAAGGAL